MSPLQQVKLWLVDTVHLGKDALHVYVALFLVFGSALVFGWQLSSWRPWLVAAAAALLGEAWDIRDRLVNDVPVLIGGNIHDVWNTLFWPTAILLLARQTRLFGR